MTRRAAALAAAAVIVGAVPDIRAESEAPRVWAPASASPVPMDETQLDALGRTALAQCGVGEAGLGQVARELLALKIARGHLADPDTIAFAQRAAGRAPSMGARVDRKREDGPRWRPACKAERLAATRAESAQVRRSKWRCPRWGPRSRRRFGRGFGGSGPSGDARESGAVDDRRGPPSRPGEERERDGLGPERRPPATSHDG
jgi:hypothetical protein